MVGWGPGAPQIDLVDGLRPAVGNRRPAAVRGVLATLQLRLLVTSNLPFDERRSVFGSEPLTGALLDRLTHHVHIPEMNCDSFRLAHSKRKTRKAKAETPTDSEEEK